MQNYTKCDNLKADKPKSLTADLVTAIDKKLNEGYLVELLRLRDGTIIARSVKKKEITALR